MAAKIEGRTITKTKISQTINLQDAFGVDFTGKRSLKEKIGQLLIDRMLERTESGKSIQGRSFKGYSKSYKESASFEKYGKSSTVNLDLKGDMLTDVDIKNVKANSLDIAITDKLQKLKSFNHITGDTLPKRDFFGVSKGDINAVKKELSGELKAIKKEDRESLRALALLSTQDGESALSSLVESLVIEAI